MIATVTLHKTGQRMSAELKEIGNVIKPCDELSYFVLIWGVTKQEAKYIIKTHDGFIDRKSLLIGEKEIRQLSENYKCLLKISESKEIVEIIIADYYKTNKGKYDFSDIRYVSELDDFYEIYLEAIKNSNDNINVISREEYAKENPYSTEKEWSGFLAITLYPDEGVNGITTNGTNQIVLNSSFLKIKERREALKQMTAIFAHEAYGHLYFKLLGRRHSHGGKRSLSDDSLQNNKELEIQIYNRENEARKHFDMHSDTYTKFLQ